MKAKILLPQYLYDSLLYLLRENGGEQEFRLDRVVKSSTQSYAQLARIFIKFPESENSPPIVNIRDVCDGLTYKHYEVESYELQSIKDVKKTIKNCKVFYKTSSKTLKILGLKKLIVLKKTIFLLP